MHDRRTRGINLDSTANTAKKIVVAEYRNRFITWINDGSESRLIGDAEWVEDALNASAEGKVVKLFDDSFSHKADVHDANNMVSVFAGLASLPLDEIRIRECPKDFKLNIKDSIHTDFFAEMLGQSLSPEEWEEFLAGATFEMNNDVRWENKGHTLKQLIQMYSQKYDN